MKRILLFLITLLPVAGYSQFQDDFTDGDFTSNPVWNGDVSSFQVLSGELNSTNQVANSSFYLSTPSTLATNAQWEMYMKLDFSTSGANYVDVYLVSDASDLNSVAAAYFVRVGGTPDEISLYRNDAGTITKIIDGVDGRSQPASANNQFNLKISRDASNLWTLQDDNSGTSTNFVTEGTATDATYSSGSFFGIFIKQSTASFFGKHYFDDINAGLIAVDVTPPTVVSATAISSTQLDVLFSENVLQSSAEIFSNYAVDNGINNPASATLDGTNPALVHLSFATSFVSATTYTVTVNGVSDLAGNTITSGNAVTFSFTADITPPVLNSATATSSTQLDVNFSEDVELASSQTAANYSVDNSIGNPTSVVRDATDFSLVHLTFSNSFSDGINYTLIVNNLKDLAGNTINANSTAAFTFSTPSAAVPYDVVITEFMADPDPVIGLPPAEFAEIFNRSNKTFDLNGWKFSDAGSPHDLPSYILTPGSYLILCSPDNAAALSAFGNALGITSFPSLNNTGGDDVVIYDNNSVVIDKIHYDETWYHDATKVDGGWSIERIDPDFTCVSAANWKASVDPSGGTPGRVNSIDGSYTDVTSPRLTRACLQDSLHLSLFFSEPIPDSALSNIFNYSILQSGIVITGGVTAASAAPDGMSVLLSLLNSAATGDWDVVVSSTLSDCAGNHISTNQAPFGTAVPSSPGDIIINEVLFSVDNGATDFVEIYNVSSKIIDLGTLKINNYTSGGDPNSQVPLSTGCFVMFPSTYIALSDNASLIKAHYIILDENAFLDMDLPALRSDEDIVVLKNSGGEVLDSLHYYTDWHLPLLNDEHNVSLERLSFSRSTNDPSNWHSASETSGYATPGYRNSQQSEGGSGSSEIEILPEVFSPDNDGYNDVVNISFHFTTPGYVANVKVFDSKGRPVRKLVENTLLGNENTFSWDGINDNKEKARTGIYVFYIEVFNLEGDVKEYKKTCVLATRL
jgi:hypothetical protein